MLINKTVRKLIILSIYVLFPFDVVLDISSVVLGLPSVEFIAPETIPRYMIFSKCLRYDQPFLRIIVKVNSTYFRA